MKRRIEVTFRCFDENGKASEYRRTVRWDLWEIAQSRVPLSDRAGIHADKFWESIVLMGVLDERETK